MLSSVISTWGWIKVSINIISLDAEQYFAESVHQCVLLAEYSYVIEHDAKAQNTESWVSHDCYSYKQYIGMFVVVSRDAKTLSKIWLLNFL